MLSAPLQKYWDRLSPQEQKMQFDEEGLYSLTPQVVANQIANNTRGQLVVDAFCGIGGNAIAFARAGKRVIAIDSNASRLKMAEFNAELFGVKDLVEFRHQDFLTATVTGAEAIFLDPPWGGVDYSRLEKFSLRHFSPDGNVVFQKSFSITPNVVCKLPRNFDENELSSFQRAYTLEENLLKEKLLHRTVYFS